MTTTTDLSSEPAVTKPEPPRSTVHRARRARVGPFRLSIVLGVAIGGLVFLSVATVLMISFTANVRNTFSLLLDRADLAVTLAERRLEALVTPASGLMAEIARLVEVGVLDPDDREAFLTALALAQAGTPQVTGIAYLHDDLTMDVAVLGPDGPEVFPDDVYTRDMLAMAWDEALDNPEGYWAEVIYIGGPDQSAINWRQPLWRDGELTAVLTAVISVRSLSEFLLDLTTSDGSEGSLGAFLLYGEQDVLAHPNLASGEFPGVSIERPMPSIFDIDDPILVALRTQGEDTPVETQGRVDATFADIDGTEEGFVAFSRELSGLADAPLTLGVYYDSEDVGAELERLAVSGIVGLVALFIAVVLAAVMGKRIARPIRRLAAETTAISTLDLEETKELPGSMIRELDEQASSFNRMVAGLRWFETYVPRRLVKRLMATGRDQSVLSDERQMTVMFSDIAGFTAQSEAMPAARTAALLNHHFALMAQCIEKEGGTIDKFLGDGVMAFWGAPDRQADHASRAARTVLAIADAIDLDNRQRAEDGGLPIKLRIGLHSGTVVVGNIGAPERMNYTIVGDTVNTAKRLEQLGKVLGTAEETVTILISAETAAALEPDAFHLERCGAHPVPGRGQPIEVCRLGGADRGKGDKGPA
ncbi:MAG: adenylate/guanylate cyclase domain-containing protein [Pseudomonadota bacterium]